MASKGLTDKQQRFVAEYAIDLNATQAAIRAGYSAHTAQEQGSRLLSNVMVRAVLTTALAKPIEAIERTAADVARKRWAIIDDPDTATSDVLTALRDEQKRFAEYSEKHDVHSEVDLVERRYIGVEVRQV